MFNLIFNLFYSTIIDALFLLYFSNKNILKNKILSTDFKMVLSFHITKEQKLCPVFSRIKMSSNAPILLSLASFLMIS